MASNRFLPDWLDGPHTAPRARLAPRLVREIAVLVSGATLFLGVALIGYRGGREAERLMLMGEGVCHVPPEPTDLQPLAWYGVRRHGAVDRRASSRGDEMASGSL